MVGIDFCKGVSMYHVVLVEPEIPQNTGNIARTCAATNTRLHLVRPLGFNIDDKSVRRAGLDYWQYVDLEVHDSLEAFIQEHREGAVRIPMSEQTRLRSLNLSNSVNIILFEALRQNGFPGLQ